jgi:signal peptidase I
MNFHLLFSRTARHANEMCKHAVKLLHSQRDLLAPPAIQAMEASIADLRSAVAARADKAALIAKMDALETTAGKWLKPYPFPSIRENIEVILVAIAVAMAIRTFFLQPFKIPTGSMQPTLYGITHEDLRGKQGVEIPGFFTRFVDSWFRGTSYFHLVAEDDGELLNVEQPVQLLPFVKKQNILVGARTYTIWFPPDNLPARAGFHPGQFFKRGEDIIKLRVTSGDHLFVDRVSYNFRRPHRGDIIVFETRGIRHERMPQDQFYIKRLVGLGGERLRIGDDNHLIVNGQRLDASAPGFERVYTFDRGTPRSGSYFGHVNNNVGPGLAPLFPSSTAEVTIGPNRYMAMGDNTLNSFDSRGWGDLPRENVIGKSFFVYWPFSTRWALGAR